MGQSQDGVGTQTFTSMAAQLGETREWMFFVSPDENYLSIGGPNKIDRASR